MKNAFGAKRAFGSKKRTSFGSYKLKYAKDVKKLKYGTETIHFGSNVTMKKALRKLDKHLKDKKQKRFYSGIKKVSEGVYKMTK